MKRRPLELTVQQRQELEELIAPRKTNAGLVQRVRVVLRSAAGVLGAEIARGLGVSEEHVARVRTRFLRGGVAALHERPRAGRKDHAVPQETVDRIVQMALSPPPPGRSRWTTRLIGREVNLTSWTVSKILRKNNLKPHRLRTYKVSRDKAFEAKVTDVVGLYLNPPENAVVLSLDEKTSVQALERTQLPLPLRQGRAVRHTHDYKRHGVVDLYAALNIATGEVSHAVTESHKSADFLRFMKQVAREHPRTALHVVLDNSSTHKTPAVKKWLEKHPRITLHFTPTSASWLNQVEGFFGILAKQSLTLTHFPSKKALRDHLEAYISNWNLNPTPFIWTKQVDAIIESRRRMVDRISHALH